MPGFRRVSCGTGALVPLCLTGSLLMLGCGSPANSNLGIRAVEGVRPASAMRQDTTAAKPEFNTEAYDSVQENDFVEALQQAQSTFSIDVDTASYANVRRFVSQGQRPPAGAVRLEELINYFGYEYPEPEGEHPFSVSAEMAGCPWNEGHQLLRIGLKGQSIDFQQRPPCNLVFLLDVSGSMMDSRKLPLVKSAMRLLTEELAEPDRIAVVVYAGASGLVLDSTSAARSTDILDAIESLTAGGSTNAGEGIQLAYRVAREHFIPGGINRIILCTDGDFNVGVTDESQLVNLIETQAKSGVFLTVLGFGTGNLKDSMMEKLADRGNGNYAYIDSILEARKVLVEQMGGTLVTIAKDVKIQVDFNPLHVRAYRLLGYENRLLANQDFRDDSKDAGEIGAGHTVTAFYEVVPTGTITPASQSRESEFVTKLVSEQADRGTRLTVNLSYKLPESQSSREFQVRVPAGAVAAVPSGDFQFASAVVAYGLLLRESSYAGSANWDWVIACATANLGPDERGLRGEFVQLAQHARRLVRDGRSGQKPGG